MPILLMPIFDADINIGTSLLLTYFGESMSPFVMDWDSRVQPGPSSPWTHDGLMINSSTNTCSKQPDLGGVPHLDLE